MALAASSFAGPPGLPDPGGHDRARVRPQPRQGCTAGRGHPDAGDVHITIPSEIACSLARYQVVGRSQSHTSYRRLAESCAGLGTGTTGCAETARAGAARRCGHRRLPHHANAVAGAARSRGNATRVSSRRHSPL